ncbi:MAG: MFS transporter [Candidatus Levybacteria bacterium]|nr:MFS transporter [Candidatus Levybacteria bacterium]
MKDGALKILFISNGIFVFADSLLGPLYAVFVQKFADGVLAISISWTAFLISTTLFTFLISRVGDKIRKDDMLMASFIVRAIVWLSYIFVGNIPQLIALQIFLGIGEALGSPSFSAIFAEHLDKNHHVQEYADWRLIANIVTAVGTMLGGLIVAKLGFEYLFLAMSLLAVISFLEILQRSKKAGIA